MEKETLMQWYLPLRTQNETMMITRLQQQTKKQKSPLHVSALLHKNKESAK
jgi:hypothetical protein